MNKKDHVGCAIFIKGDNRPLWQVLSFENGVFWVLSLAEDEQYCYTPEEFQESFVNDRHEIKPISPTYPWTEEAVPETKIPIVFGRWEPRPLNTEFEFSATVSGNPIDALEPFIRAAAKAEGKEVDEEWLKAARAYCEEPVIVVGRCKDCAFWRKFKKRPVGQCSCEKLNYSKPEVGCEPDGVWFWAEYANRAGLETGPDFGCIHWKARE